MNKPITYLDDFLNKYPKCPVNNNGTPRACRQQIYGGSCDLTRIYDNCKQCWNTVMEKD